MPLEKEEKQDMETVVPQELTSTEEITNLLKAVESDKEGNVQKIIITEDIFKKIKESLLATIESMERNPSFISRVAEFWAELPLWQKILGGAALTVPILILGIVANIGFLLAICGVTAIFYGGSGILLDNHHRCTTNATESLSKGIISLADLLELTITALDVIRQKLSEEVQKFTRENEKLAENVTLLDTKIERLSRELEASFKIAVSLKETKTELEQAIKKLEDQATKQNELLDKHQKDLAHLNDEYSKCQAKMASDVVEFSKLKDQLKEEVADAKQLADYFGTMCKNMGVKLLKDNEEAQQKFCQRLNDFLADEKASFAALAERWGVAEENLKKVQEELKLTNEKHEAILNKQIEYTQKLEAIAFKIAATYSPKVKEVIDQVGFFGKNSHNPEEKKKLDQALNNFLGEFSLAQGMN
jgi:hypothetical protein